MLELSLQKSMVCVTMRRKEMITFALILERRNEMLQLKNGLNVPTLGQGTWNLGEGSGDR